MPNKNANIFSVEQQQAQIVARMMVQCLSVIRPEDFGTRSIGTAMERVMVLFAVLQCQGEGQSCTQSRLIKQLKMPRASVQRTLDELIARQMVQRVERHYVPAPDGKRVSSLGGLVAAVIAAGQDLTLLHGVPTAKGRTKIA
jgi:predicted transcriptional regulator